VILIDANLLIYAHMGGMPAHAAAHAWLDERLAGPARVGLPWPSLLAYVRLCTSRRLFARPDTVAAAWEQVEDWLDRSCVWIPTPTEIHRELLARLLRDAADGGNLVPDAHLAALAIEHGLTLCSADRGFARFRGLRWENPLGG
jgi:toxin-antitoxin system PIN domain toxin